MLSELFDDIMQRSHPSRGAWIEMRSLWSDYAHAPRRTPHGVRGLKCMYPEAVITVRVSHPSRGAWIEIRQPRNSRRGRRSRTPHGVRGLK